MIERTTPPGRSAARAFTLIELLTVIAIIGVLAAILIPTIGKVREMARASNTTSNLRQTGQALLSYVADNRDLLPGSPGAVGAVGLIASVNYQYERNPQGGGGYSDRRCRLGYYLAAYGGVKPDANGPVDIPMFRDAAWEDRMRGESSINMDAPTSRNWAVIYALNTQLSRAQYPNLPAATVQPFGNQGAVGGAGGVPNGAGPMRYGVVAGFVTLSRTWWITQADQDLDQVSHITDNDVNASLRTPYFKDKRITGFFDGSVRAIPVAQSLRGPL